MGCCQKAEKDENVDDEYEIPYSFDEYETPYKFTTDSVTKLWSSEYIVWISKVLINF